MFRPRAEVNAWAMPRPRLVWWFEGTYVALGVELSNGLSDPVVLVQLAGDVKPRTADRLSNALYWIGKRVCQLIGHRYEPVSLPPDHPDNPRTDGGLYFNREQCSRCLDLRPRA